MSNLRLAVIPAAGRAVRLNGLPKFLLPISPASNLLSYHLQMASEYADLIVVGTRPEFSGLVQQIAKDFGAKTCVVETQTLTETVCELASGLNPKTLTVQLPDTYVGNENIFASLEADVYSRELSGMAVWRSAESQRGLLGQVEIGETAKGPMITKIVDKDPYFFTGFHWGSISFYEPDTKSWNRNEPTIGNVVSNLINDGESVFSLLGKAEYFDLGTISTLKDFYLR